jgi:hypothetical protein
MSFVERLRSPKQIIAGPLANNAEALVFAMALFITAPASKDDGPELSELRGMIDSLAVEFTPSDLLQAKVVALVLVSTIDGGAA